MLQNIESIEELKITNTNDIKEIKMYQTKNQKKWKILKSFLLLRQKFLLKTRYSSFF